jgi:hypothetical protein
MKIIFVCVDMRAYTELMMLPAFASGCCDDELDSKKKRPD